VAAFRAAIDRCIDLALHAQERIERSDELELLSPASLGVVTFRRRPPGVDDEAVLERINADLADRIEQSGEVFISTGRVHGRYALRLCILNHSTTQSEVDLALELAEKLEVDASPAPSVPVSESYRPLDEGWLGRSSLGLAGLRSISLFTALDDRGAQLVLTGAREQLSLAGETVVEQWQVSRDLYVVLEGSARVEVDGRVVRVLGAGDFFGEVAALDWGAGFGRTRTATVVTQEESRLLALDWTLVHRLIKSSPAFGDTLEAMSRSRLASSA
jgi:aromatic-L-amino-acid/L-tryptophan decarboxylase